jgi:signal recognition particle subunit SRP54
MTSQESVNVAKTFEEQIGIEWCYTYKDGRRRPVEEHTLSVKSVTGKPIKFVGIGEKTDALEPFFPDRMASRILGMGEMY